MTASHSTDRAPGGSLRALFLRWLWTAPALVSVGVMLAYPTLYLLALSFTKSNLGRPFQSWRGAQNYIASMYDQAFMMSLLRSVAYAIPASVFQVVLGLALALLLRGVGKPGRRLLFLLLIPLMTPPMMAGIIWRLLLAPSGGLVNGLLMSHGVISQPISFLGSGPLAWLAIAVADSWQWVPFITLMVYAALSNIPDDILEAAALDGAGPFQRLRLIVLPLLWPALVSIFLLKLVIALKLFDAVYILTFGGPADATTVASFRIWRTGLEQFDVGKAAAQTVIFSLLVTLVTYPLVKAHQKMESH